MGVKLTNFVLEKNEFKFSKTTDVNLKKNDSCVSEINGITIGNNVTNISGLLEESYLLINDFEIPSHITDCTNAFKNCTSMTHVHSNWKNSYANITPTDCYAGCTAITHIDDKNIVTYEGKEGLDEIPIVWGGLELMAVNTFVLRFEIPSDNFTLKFTDIAVISGNKTVSWGDKTYTNGETEHTYAKAGIYIVKTQLRPIPSGSWGDESVINTLVEVYQVPTARIGYAFSFGKCIKLVKANLTNVNMTTAAYCFYGCSSLEEVILTNAIIEGSGNVFFSGCTNLKGIDLSAVDFSNVNNMNGFASGCSSLRYFYAPKNINVSMSDFTESIYLTSEHLMSIINNLNTVSTAQTLTIGSTHLAKLTAEQIKIATDKNWTVV